MLLLGCSVFPAQSVEGSFAEQTAVLKFIDSQVQKGAERESLEQLFTQMTPNPRVLELIQRAPERKATWPQYRDIFIRQQRIDQGRAFMRNHSELLTRAEARYGVPREVIVAILGVETYYGNRTGGNKVVRSLATLAFGYPRRSDFFRSELEAFLHICRDQGIDPLSPMGSYAGAMGYPQFMPSSYLSYAVDFNDDGSIDIWSDAVDAIGSIGNYLQEAGRWEAGRPMLEEVTNPSNAGGLAALAGGSLRPSVTRAQLKAVGVTPQRLQDDQKFSVLAFDHPDKSGQQYWLGGANFYAVTRYNISAYYSLVVHQLAELIATGQGDNR